MALPKISDSVAFNVATKFAQAIGPTGQGAIPEEWLERVKEYDPAVYFCIKETWKHSRQSGILQLHLYTLLLDQADIDDGKTAPPPDQKTTKSEAKFLTKFCRELFKTVYTDGQRKVC